MQRGIVGSLSLCLALFCLACTKPVTAPSNADYVLLVPDWKNHVVHRVALDGTYEGDFLDPARTDNPDVRRGLWAKPMGILYLDGNPGTFWTAAGRALAEWDTQGRLVRPILEDTTVLETPTCMVRIGDEIFVASADQKDMHVFGLDGTHKRSFGYGGFTRANDCKVGGDGMIYVGSTMLNNGTPGLISVWDPEATGQDAKPIEYRIPGDVRDDGTYWVHGLVFDDNGDLLITDFARGRLERWDLDKNERLEVLLDSNDAGAYAKLDRGPDGLVYMAGAAGVYRFDSRAHAADLEDLKPFFDARQLTGRYNEPFSPAGITIVPRAVLATKD